MRVGAFTEGLAKMGIHSVIGVPDSTLKVFCDYMNSGNEEGFEHITAANEGSAVGMAAGTYLATGQPACVYMQNSGIGNIVNPLTSIANREVYGIPMLFLIGWRGEPGKHDEPQHKFMGRITEEILDVLEVGYAVIDRETTESDYKTILQNAEESMRADRQYAIIIKKGTFEAEKLHKYQNNYKMNRESAIATILKSLSEKDLVVSTTGKISREAYEQSDMLFGHHRQEFLTVGGMGHASMIAYGIARQRPERKVICIDGDGAVLMHMGNLAFIGNHPLNNLVHICLNNDSHESVGGMATGASGMHYEPIAKVCGYTETYSVASESELETVLAEVREKEGIFFVEAFVTLDSREDLGRPKESAAENKKSFMEYQEKTR